MLYIHSYQLSSFIIILVFYIDFCVLYVDVYFAMIGATFAFQTPLLITPALILR